ncbi:CHAT domain-containing protein [Nonomuraea africana]|uniref:Tetratricopeptide (TPR) repeat protein n=1 Tax=Nonomuraea africana TaxID=46171 RepID=A0ABR9K8I0_9ACTN|nr:CHAT domain-containing tetratricopeptide repeat protein [Nonomuraea africana]MBE1558058.1 tetratricopeptide (TPR) repeat protein [Nonomuraea africana]
MTDALVARAEEAVLQSGIDPARALESARAVHAEAEETDAVEAAVIALRAMALACRELGDLETAERHLRRAIATSDAPADRLAQARLSLVTVRTQRGHPLQALRVAAMAWAYLSPLDRAKLDTQRAVALAHLGRHQEAVASCDRALAVLAEAPGTIDDQRFRAGGLLNRGLVHAYQGRWRQATRDIAACLELSQRAGLAHLARLAAANLPFLAVRQGDIPAAFTHYRACEDTLFGFPERLATMRADFAGALLAAHLPGEARAMLSLAVPELEASGAQVALAEARLRLAQVELVTGDARQALAVARRAEAELTAQGCDSWRLAAEVVLRARLALEPPSAELLERLLACAHDLTSSSYTAEAAAVRLAAAELALTLGDTATATAQLSLLDPEAAAHCPAQEPRHLAPLLDAPALSLRHLIPLASAQQAAYLGGEPEAGDGVPSPVRWHAAALLATLRDDSAAAFAAVHRGLREVGSDASRFDDPSLRAHMARAGQRLASYGLGLAIDTCGPEVVFAWAERWRAVAGGRPDAPGLTAVRAALAGGALVEFVCHDDALLVLVITAAGVTLRRVCDTATVSEAVIRLRYGLRRASLGDAVATGERGPDPVRAEAVLLERLLFEQVAAEIEGRPLVIVPAGPLHTLPWSVLPCLHARPVSVVPSAAAWLAARERTRRAEPLVIAAAGPGLRHATTEVERVLAAHRRTELVRGRVADVADALGRADVLHLAAHGTFHSRSPLLSSIELEDGPLMAYDLLTHDSPPRLVVLSACDSGMARVPAEGAPLGLAGTFLARGAACVVAGLIPVPDDEALALMTLFHELIAAGEPPAAALATASSKSEVPGFACFGAGEHPVLVSRSRRDAKDR